MESKRELLQLHVFVSGRVQGVGFRASTIREALQYADVGGWVRNLSDGRVEAVFVGDAVSVHALAAWCRKGPSSSQVAECLVNEEPVDQALITQGFRLDY